MSKKINQNGDMADTDLLIKLKREQISRHFAYDILKRIFWNERVWIWISYKLPLEELN